MSDQKKRSYTEPPPPEGKRKMRVVPGSRTVDEPERKPKIRVVLDEGDRLTTEEWRQRFARNLDRLLGLVGLSRKEAAEQIGIPYQMLRRLVSAGISRTDERRGDDLAKIADYFTLTDVEFLWRSDLIRLLLKSEWGRDFVQKFRTQLLAERERRVAEAQQPQIDELSLLSTALGFRDSTVPPLTGPDADKVAAILASSKADTFRRIIDDYYELVERLAGGPDDLATKRFASGSAR